MLAKVIAANEKHSLASWAGEVSDLHTGEVPLGKRDLPAAANIAVQRGFDGDRLSIVRRAHRFRASLFAGSPDNRMCGGPF
jgi:hypothetical protein